jgi:hypothetical protein
MVTQRCLIKLRDVSMVFAALSPGLTRAVLNKLVAPEPLAMSMSSGPCLKGAGASDAGPGSQPA